MLDSDSTDSGSPGVFPCVVYSVDIAHHSRAASLRLTLSSTWHLYTTFTIHTDGYY